MKHIRKFENFSNSMDFPDRLENECPECSKPECNCSSEQSDDTNDNEYPKTNYQRFDDQGNDWYGFDHPEELDEVPTNDDDNDGEDLPKRPVGSDEEEGDEEYWGDENIQLENNLLMFKDFFINEKKKGKVNKGLQDFLDKKAGKKSKSKEDEEDENVKPDFLDLNKNGDKKEPMKKAAKEAKEKEAKEKSSKK
jgi:hypothetical protein